MSATLDLNGQTVTLSADSVNYYYQITDTSSSHNGTLILQPGAEIVFDDASGAGFSSGASAITITVNGNSTSPCYVSSAISEPSNDWTMPALTANVTATRCTFADYVIPFSAPGAWVLNNCVFEQPIPAVSPYDFSMYFPHRLSIEVRQGYGMHGAPTYGAPTVVPGYYNSKIQNVLTSDGNEVVSDSFILFNGGVSVHEYDRITLPDGTVRPVKTVSSSNMPNSGACVLKTVYL